MWPDFFHINLYYLHWLGATAITGLAGSPRKALKVYVEASILELPKIYVNAGKRGLLAEISPQELKRVLNPIAVNVAI